MIKIPEGYKKYKNRIIPQEWDFVKIDTLLEKIGKKVNVEKEELYQQIGIKSHGKGLFHKGLVTGEELGNKSVFWVEKDCFIVNIVFAWEQAIGRTTEKEVGMICSHRFPMYRPKESRVDIDYLVYLFKTPYGKKVLELASPGGAGRNKTLGQKEFMNSEILIPNSIKEQEKIVEIISTWDLAIEKQEQLIEKKKEFKKGLIQRLLSEEIRFKEFNDEWKVRSFEKCLKVISCKGKSLQSKMYKDIGKYPIIDQGKKLIAGFSDDHDKVIVNDGIIIFGDHTRIIKYYNDDFIQGADGTQLLKSIDDNKYITKYLYYCLLGKNIPNTGYNRHLKFVKEFKFAIPSLNEQKKIVEVLSSVDKEIELLEKELEALKLQKKGLMQRLLTGEVRVKV